MCAAGGRGCVVTYSIIRAPEKKVYSTAMRGWWTMKKKNKKGKKKKRRRTGSEVARGGARAAGDKILPPLAHS